MIYGLKHTNLILAHIYFPFPYSVFQAEKQWTPLLLAARNGHLDSIHLLTGAGADINARNSEGKTAVYLAACG